MLIKFIAKNIYSFKDETEFNLLPNKTHRLSHHKVSHSGIDFLRLSAIYGANGSGKSNLIKCISILKNSIESGKIVEKVDELKFRLSEENANIPISFGIEFYAKTKVYYYSLTFDKGVILNEYLAESKREKDILIFERSNDENEQVIRFYNGYTKTPKNKLFVEILAEKLLQKNELLISFLSSKYADEFTDSKVVFDWFFSTLVVIRPDTKPDAIAHVLDTDTKLKDFANYFIPKLKTGVNKLNIEKEHIEKLEKEYGTEVKELLSQVKNEDNIIAVLSNKENGEEFSAINGEVYVKRIVATHLNDKGKEVDFPLSMLSDGTKRLFDYIPALYDIVQKEKVYIIDEIERSIHPITIKEIISKFSLDESAKGQLIFTTHESCLLDQEIFRTDEIWLAQKAIDGVSKLYSLSDFNIHNTANIENGYLNGRFGGIPFLSNLKDLNWHKYEVSEQEQSL